MVIDDDSRLGPENHVIVIHASLRQVRKEPLEVWETTEYHREVWTAATTFQAAWPNFHAPTR
jgi:hypothetical protein